MIISEEGILPVFFGPRRNVQLPKVHLPLLTEVLESGE